MGQLISNLTSVRGKDDSLVPDVGLDFENVLPTSAERPLYDEASRTLIAPTTQILSLLRSYKPASELIRRAIQDPSLDNEEAAWNALEPTVSAMRQYYLYSVSMKKIMPQLLLVLCEGDVGRNLQANPALSTLVASVLDFTFEFDYLKMCNATLQNDFSYYRRLLQRERHLQFKAQKTAVINGSQVSDLRATILEDDVANHISLFIAYPMPMLKSLIHTIADFVMERQLQKGVCDCLATLWAACYNSVAKARVKSPEAVAFRLKVMVVAIILYDHIDPQGAFSKRSPINIKSSVKAIQAVGTTSDRQMPRNSSASNLMSALRYNAKHLNDDSTPKAIRTVVMAS
ncbi:hypothetical protein BZG36_00942 [Bifiguratus adelaidae]|uniref:CYRIA/CYRIB Rac1 binding domain-containing protein n=1 Tax=Bifiguratus adelaidae TaxID=1938954 RepID=A0A261Y5E8_9FUNG|nr:hypothetical protein BZG36_00942 [Bifiguratus adelaidae]